MNLLIVCLLLFSICLVIFLWMCCVLAARSDDKYIETNDKLYTFFGTFRKSKKCIEQYCIAFEKESNEIDEVGLKSGKKFSVKLKDGWVDVCLLDIDDTYYFDDGKQLIEIPEYPLLAKISYSA